jgi:hypothetical protein
LFNRVTEIAARTPVQITAYIYWFRCR